MYGNPNARFYTDAATGAGADEGAESTAGANPVDVAGMTLLAKSKLNIPIFSGFGGVCFGGCYYYC